MGSILDISCRECRYNKEYFLGVGEFFGERENKSMAIVNKLAGVDKSEILIEESSIQVFRCFGCNSLFNKLEISYRIKNRLPVLYNILYKCNKCRQPLYPLFNDNVFCIRHNDDVISDSVKILNPGMDMSSIIMKMY
ncbi:MAG: hypothetical protein IPL53_06300 [Ignavibacteria bacterium]|nr:hypothetical protein [Ignavibacteria bacterium]